MGTLYRNGKSYGGGTSPIATENSLGIVRPDGTSIVIDENGVISSVGGGSVTPSLSDAEMKVLGWNVPLASPIQNELDGDNFIQRVDRVDLGELTWTLTGIAGRFYAPSPTNAKALADGGNPKYCERYQAEYGENQSIMINDSYYSSNARIYILDTAYASADALKSSLQGVYLYYLLEVPITTLLGSNTIGEAYSDTKSYSTGDYCIYNNMLYKCKVACVGQTPTNTTYWMATSVTNELKTKNIVTTVAPTAGATSTYPVGTTIDVIE